MIWKTNGTNSAGGACQYELKIKAICAHSPETSCCRIVMKGPESACSNSVTVDTLAAVTKLSEVDQKKCNEQRSWHAPYKRRDALKTVLAKLWVAGILADLAQNGREVGQHRCPCGQHSLACRDD